MSTFDAALLVLRLGIGLIFAVHGAQKLFGWWKGPGFTGWQGAMGHMGFRPAPLFAGVSAVAEFGGGLGLALGLLTPFVATLLIGQSVVIIGSAHWRSGFFNRDNGYEFPLALRDRRRGDPARRTRHVQPRCAHRLRRSAGGFARAARRWAWSAGSPRCSCRDSGSHQTASA